MNREELIKKLEEIKDLKNYDFKDTFESECLIGESDYKKHLEDFWNKMQSASDDPIKKLGIWKHKRTFSIPGNKRKVSKTILHDCDSTKLALSIMNEYMFNRMFDESNSLYKFREKYNNKFACEYQKIPKKENLDKKINFKYMLTSNSEDMENKISYIGDTMNSFQTIASTTLRLICKKRRGIKIGGYNTFIILEGLLKDVKNNDIEGLQDKLIIKSEDVLNKSIEILKKLKRLSELTHTIGNFILVPSGTFNGERYAPTKDFFDLTLEGIRQYYLDEEHTPLCGLLWCDKQNKAWLDSFKSDLNEDGNISWQNFIKLNFLDDYVDEDYNVKLFYKGHSFSEVLPIDYAKLKKPKESDILVMTNKLNDCLGSMCNRIAARSERICNYSNEIKKGI